MPFSHIFTWHCILVVAIMQNYSIFGFVFSAVWLGSNPGGGKKSCTTGASHWSHPVWHDDWCGKTAVSHLHCGRREHVRCGFIDSSTYCMNWKYYCFSKFERWFCNYFFVYKMEKRLKLWLSFQNYDPADDPPLFLFN